MLARVLECTVAAHIRVIIASHRSLTGPALSFHVRVQSVKANSYKHALPVLFLEPFYSGSHK